VGGNVSAGSTREFYLQWKVEAGEHFYQIKLYSSIGEQTFEKDSWNDSISVTTGIKIVSVECPGEVNIPGELWCSIVVNNSLSTKIDVIARIRLDGELIDLSRTFGNINPTLDIGKNKFCIGITIDSDLARYEFNYNSFLDFLDSDIITKENCGHRVSECQIFEWLPTPHYFTIEIHRDNNLLTSKGVSVTLAYGNYYENKFIEYYVIPLTSGVTAGTATALVEGISAGVAATKVGVVTGIIVEAYNLLKSVILGG
jgi:hypothetical protein